MGKLTSFTFITLNGFFKGPKEDTSWHPHGGEASEYANKASGSGNILLFGRKTYEMMANFWPTPMASELFPVVAENMNKSQKIVCSNTLKPNSIIVKGWKNTTILKNDIIEQIAQLKKSSNKDLTILGSGSLLTQLSDVGLIDQYIIMFDPIALGKGTSIFEGLKNRLDLKLSSTQIFKKDGIVVLNYERK